MTALKIADINAPRPKITITVVTPKLAKTWLATNVRNRAISPAVVGAYARDMAAGNWQLTCEPIKFDTNGHLADGQHRLSGVVQAGVPVEMMIVEGVLPETQTVMDSGRKRTASDGATLLGQKNPAILAAAGRFALRESGCGFVDSETRVVNPTNSEIANFIETHPSIHNAADIAQHYYPQFDAPPSVLTVCWMRFADIDLAAAGLFFSSIANMATEGYGDPRAALVRRLANARRGNEKLNQTAYLSLIFRAWNAWRTGQTATKFQTESRGSSVKVPERLR